MNHQQNDCRDIFVRALELESDARDLFLIQACARNLALEMEVRCMLADFEKADDYFQDGEASALIAAQFETPYTEVEGERVGNCILRQQIGEGGFGMVWMAEQIVPIKRMVALKVVKAGMDTRQVLARFEAERQALAIMSHPNIAKVFEAGATASGRPYFTMELVKGISITEFCDQRQFDVRQRLELFRDVCSAVQHAHQKGVIHRDLKPSNVMVTLDGDKPLVKVIDFGIAKATQSKLTEKTLFTRFGQFLGTPAYMSPEQAAMSAVDVDTRSDIYSLGVLLYELLAGTPPFDQKTLLSVAHDEMLRIIREQEPHTPSARLSQMRIPFGADAKRKSLVPVSVLKGELDWIVMRAIEKDRSRRYESASAFAADIGRYLANEPVQAAAPGAFYLYGKFARRNQVVLGTAAAMLILLLAGIVTTAWQAARATAEMQRALAAEELAARRLAEAEAFASTLREVLESQLTGYWQTNLKKTLELAKRENREINFLEEGPLQKTVLEIRQGEMYVHGPPGNTAENPPKRFTIKQPSGAEKTLVMEFAEDQDEPYSANFGSAIIGSAIIENETLTISTGNMKLVLIRMSVGKFADFAKREARAKAAAIARRQKLSQPIIDLADVEDLENLNKLEVKNKSIVKCDIPNLPKLKEFSAFMSSLPTLDFLQHTTAIEKLNLFGSDHTFKDYRALLFLKNIRELDISSNRQATDVNLKDLAGLTSLEKFSMGLCTEVTNLDFLRNNKGLREINVQACLALRNMDALAAFADLEVLDLRSTRVSDISFLKNAKKLRELDLSNTQVTDISALVGATALERLNLDDTSVTDLSPLLPMLRASGLPLINIPKGISAEQRRLLTEATTLAPEEIKRLAPTGLTLVVCNHENEVLDTLVIPAQLKSAEYIFRIPEGLKEIRVFGLGSRIRKHPDQWDNIHETFTQFYTVARANDKISQAVTANLEDGALSYFGTSINAAFDSRPIRLTETARNQIHADIAADQRTMPIMVKEKSDTDDGVRSERQP